MRKTSFLLAAFLLALTSCGGGAVAPDTIKIVADSTTLKVDDTEQLSVVATPNGASVEVTWDCDDESVLTVSDTGLVTAIGAGEALVVAASKYAISGSYAADIISFTVTEDSDILSISEARMIEETTNVVIEGNVLSVFNDSVGVEDNLNYSFVIGDGTGYMVVFNGMTVLPEIVTIGAFVNVSGEASFFNGVVQIGEGAVITAGTGTNPNIVLPEPQSLTTAEYDAYDTDLESHANQISYIEGYFVVGSSADYYDLHFKKELSEESWSTNFGMIIGKSSGVSISSIEEKEGDIYLVSAWICDTRHKKGTKERLLIVSSELYE